MRSALPIVVPLLALGCLARDATRPSPRLRETLLREARERLLGRYADKSGLDPPFGRDGATVQQTSESCLCDGPGRAGQVPLTFGSFDVEGARPVDVFNALADLRGRMEWDPTVKRVETIPGGWQEREGVEGVEMLYPSGILLVPDREVFEWAAYEADAEGQEFWVAYSTLGNGELKAALAPSKGAVEAQNCLGAFWVRGNANGGSHVLFTQHVNVQAPAILSPRLVFAVSWGKQVDFINLLRQRAQGQAALGWPAGRVAVAPALLRPPPDGGGAFRNISFARRFALARPEAELAPRAAGAAAYAVLLAALLFATAAGLLGLRRSARRQPASTLAAAVSEESSRLLQEGA